MTFIVVAEITHVEESAELLVRFLAEALEVFCFVTAVFHRPDILSALNRPDRLDPPQLNFLANGFRIPESSTAQRARGITSSRMFGFLNTCGDD